MRVIAKKILRDFWENHNDCAENLNEWFHSVEKEIWNSPYDVKNKYGNVSLVGENRAVFNIKGNKYRLIVQIDYIFKFVFILWIGTHKEYNKINVKTIEYVKRNK